MAAIASTINSAQTQSLKASCFYAPELDLLRFFAFLVVFVRHVATGFGIAKQQQVASTVAAVSSIGAAGAYGSSRWGAIQDLAQSFDFGVCLFFFLSSFLITSLLLIERAVSGGVDVRGFYIRRALRIWPLYFTFLGIMAVLGSFQPWLRLTTPRLLASVFFVANWPVVLHGWIGSPIEPLWSVSVEEQFYIVWPQFARLGRVPLIAISLAMALVPYPVLIWISGHAGCQNTSMWANSLVQCLFFAGGSLTATFAKGRTPRLRRVARIALFAAGWTLWLTASGRFHVVRTISPGTRDLIAGYTLVLAGTLLIFLSCLGWKPAWMPRSLYELGKISYGLYVFHFYLLELVTHGMAALSYAFGLNIHSLLLRYCIISVVALTATIVSAKVSYRYLEQPFLRFKDRFTVVPSRPA